MCIIFIFYNLKIELLFNCYRKQLSRVALWCDNAIGMLREYERSISYSYNITREHCNTTTAQDEFFYFFYDIRISKYTVSNYIWKIEIEIILTCDQ